MKTTLAIMVIMVFLVSGAGLVLAQSVPVPSDKEPAGAAQEPDQGQGAGAEAKVAGLKGAKKPAGYAYGSGRQKKGRGPQSPARQPNPPIWSNPVTRSAPG